jgi:hypothetical protein
MPGSNKEQWKPCSNEFLSRLLLLFKFIEIVAMEKMECAEVICFLDRLGYRGSMIAIFAELQRIIRNPSLIQPPALRERFLRIMLSTIHDIQELYFAAEYYHWKRQITVMSEFRKQWLWVRSPAFNPYKLWDRFLHDRFKFTRNVWDRFPWHSVVQSLFNGGYYICDWWEQETKDHFKFLEIVS